MGDYKSVDEYIAAQPRGAQSALKQVRGAIRKAVPEAEEGIAYKIPAYKLHGKRMFFFAGWKQHYSLYPAGKLALLACRDELARYEISKGTIRFTPDAPLPASLVTKLVKARIAERS